MRKRLITTLLLTAVCVACLFMLNRRPSRRAYRVFAQAGGSFPAAQYLQDPVDGVAQYGLAMQQSTSSTATQQAISNWNTYITGRSEYGLGLSTTLISRLSTADWNARVAGPSQITAQRLADATNQLIGAQLAAMSAAQQQALFQTMLAEATPKMTLVLNQVNPYVSASQNPDGTWVVTVSAGIFSDRKDFLQQQAPGMMSSSANFYPGEAVLVFYSVVSDDLGYGGNFASSMKKALQDFTGLDMTNRFLYGDHGYFRRRPLTTFLTGQAMSQLYSALGF